MSILFAHRTKFGTVTDLGHVMFSGRNCNVQLYIAGAHMRFFCRYRQYALFWMVFCLCLMQFLSQLWSSSLLLQCNKVELDTIDSANCWHSRTYQIQLCYKCILGRSLSAVLQSVSYSNVQIVLRFSRVIFCVCQVEILVGKDKGKQGLVNCIIKERNWVYVHGLNCVCSVFDVFSYSWSPYAELLCIRMM